MFWGLILKANKKYTQTLEKPFHLSQAALDHSSSDDSPIQVMYSHEDSSYLLCTLQKGKVMQVALDLNFAEGDKLCFMTKGNGIVHLTGYLVPEDDFNYPDFDDEGESEDGSELEETPDLREKLNSKKKKAPEKVTKVADEEEEDSEDDEDFDASAMNEEDDDSEGDDSEDGEQQEDEEDSDDSEGDDDDDESEDDEEEEEVAPPKAKQAKLDQNAAKGKDKKQQNGTMTNGQEKKGKEQQQKQEKEKPGQMQKLQGGLMYQDLTVGKGGEAKPGKKVQMYYVGRLKNNNKVFDQTTQGAGFKFILGRGEVIKGWDIGVVGMKVGGKRRLICPPQLAYGQKGSPPVIPANSTLVFDVELKNVF